MRNNIKRAKLFFIDPMSSSSSLSQYDHSIINDIDSLNVYFIGDENYKYQNVESYNFIPLFSYANKNGIFKITSYIFSLIKLFLLILFKRPDIIHLQWLKIYKLEVFYYRLLKLVSKKIKIVFTAHNLLPHNSGNKFKNTFKQFFFNVDKIIVHSQSSKEELVSTFDIPAIKIHTIKHGLLKFQYNKKQITAIQEKLKSDYGLENEIIYSALGTISSYKGTNMLVNAWANSEKLKNGNVKLLIAGKGKLENPKVANSSNGILLINKLLSDEEFHAYLLLSDLVLLPYQTISQSGVLLTALGHRKPVLVSDVGALTEIFESCDVGWKLKKDFTAIELQKELEKIYTEKDNLLLIQNDKSLWNNVDEFYSWEKISATTEQLYNDLLK